MSKKIVALGLQEQYESLGVASGLGDAPFDSSVQQRIVDVCKNPRSYGITSRLFQCEKMVEQAYNKARVPKADGSIYPFGGVWCCARNNRDSCRVSGSSLLRDNIPVGAMVYCGSEYRSSKSCGLCPRNPGHVGIYIGNGIVAHQLETVALTPLEDWVGSFHDGGWGWGGAA